MTKGLKKYFNIHNVRLLAVISLVLYSMMQKITVLEFLCKSYIFPTVILFISAVVFLWDFFSKKRMFSAKYIILPVLFIAATGLSALVNIRYGVYSNAVLIAYLVAEYAVLYPFEGYRETARRDFKVIGYVITVFSFLLSVYTYVSYLMCLEYLFRNGIHIIEQGYQSIYRRAWGVYYETNWQGILALLVIYLCIYLILNTKKLFVRILNIINIIFHIGILILTGSRSTALSVYISFGVFVWYMSLKYLRKHGFGCVKEQLLRILCGVVGAAICYGMIFSVKTSLPYIQKFSMDGIKLSTRIEWCNAIKRVYSLSNIEVEFTNPSQALIDDPLENELPEEKEEFELETIKRLDIETKEDKSNGRVHIWKDGLRLWLKTPLLGTSPSNLEEYTNDNMPDACAELLEGTSLRNGYLDVIVKGGILALIPIFLFLILCAKKLWKYQKELYSHRTEVGIILACICASMIFILFSSDLFYYRSSLNYIFIIILGYGMYLIDGDMSEQMGNRKLFVCDTPYQIMNSILIAKEKPEETSDIYVLKQFKNSDYVVSKLKDCGIFDEVVGFEPYKKYYGILHKAVTLKRIFFPLRTLKKYSEEKFKIHQYAEVYFSYYTPFSDSVRLVNSNSDFIEYEDGIGTYRVNDLEDLARTKLFGFINRYFLSGSLSYNVKAIYLNHPECYNNSDNLETVKIPFSKDYSAFKQIFGYKPDNIYDNNRFVYLTQPLEETELGESAADTERKILSELGESVVVRVHPRQNPENYSGYSVDGANNQWELECADSINDSHILIGAFSTAQFTPKMLFDKEPGVIFTYKLYGDAFENAADTVNMLRSMYKNPEKVIVAEDINQLADYISK